MQIFVHFSRFCHFYMRKSNTKGSRVAAFVCCGMKRLNRLRGGLVSNKTTTIVAQGAIEDD